MSRLGRYRRAVLAGWRELGLWGRLALGGIGLSVVITIALGLWIPDAARRHLLHGQTDIISGLVAEFDARGLIPTLNGDQASYDEFDAEVRLRLLGGDTVRVKVWTPDGVVVYSDEPALRGQRFPFNSTATEALNGISASDVSDVSEPAHAFEQHVEQLIELYIPVIGDDGSVTGLFEVEERVDTLNVTVGRIRRNTWLAIGLGLGVLTVFMASLTLANSHVLTRRRREAEDLLTRLINAQEEERRRIVGSLHDDVGQPLYRLLYGLQGSRSRLSSEDPVAAELSRLEDLVRSVDGTLRGELRTLHHGLAEDLGLKTALQELQETTQTESALELELDFDLPEALDPNSSVALFRAAQEAVTNVRKHAAARRVWIRVFEDGERVILEVRDDGQGPSGREGLGLATTRERLEAIGGGIRVVAANRSGTVVTAWTPAGVHQ